MPVDEFGREIPGYGGGGGLHSSSSALTVGDHGKRPVSPILNRFDDDRRSSSHKASDSPPRRRSRPIERYVEEPMLCEYVWKDQQENAQSVANSTDGAHAHADPAGDIATSTMPKTIENDTMEEAQENNATASDETTSNNKSNAKQAYDEYRLRYCINYIRAFFNQHIDDSWFRNRYSPLARKRLVLQFMDRATTEARALQQAWMASPDEFIQNVRLGSGVKERTHNQTSGSSMKRKIDGSSSHMYPATVPTSHLFTFQDRVLQLLDIPPHVTEDHIKLALFDHVSPKHILSIISGRVNMQDNTPHTALYRDAYCILSSPDAKRDILASIQKASVESTSEGGGAHIPRKDVTSKAVLELDVECSDPYGRKESEDEGGVVPPRKASIFIATDVTLPQKVVVLSAAVSSKKRISSDKESAFTLGRALDRQHRIGDGLRLDDLMETTAASFSQNLNDEDSLDVAICYLRRVHLFSFYNGCVFTHNLADVLSGHHPTSTIHLRLKDADDLLTDAVADDGKKDLLERRLDDSIQKALEVPYDGSYYISPEVDADADAIAKEEEAVEIEWTNQHGIIDGHDGRARCSFSFCRKLFKDESFLEKHLKKKHAEFLLAECAKCHDSYMMKSWDAEEVRPVPSVLVDCGSNFGLVSSPVLGAARPMAADPEPALWQKEEDARRRQEEQLAMRYNDHRSMNSPGSSLAAPPPPPRRSANFVDVDDMKEEKVELSFDAVEDLLIQPPKKKKRKKKLL